MCGIAGIIAGPGRSVAGPELARLSAAIAHRGPDDQGAAAWSAEGGLTLTADCGSLPGGAQVGFAHRRLSIIDTGPGGHQPMATPDGRHVLITNGEIYNYLELRRELEAEGAVFTSNSDTEVLLIALVHWGIDKTLPRLIGMFAFAHLDTARRTVSLARDPFGIKPLMWALRGGDLAIASEPGALLELADLKRAVAPQALYDYLRFGLTDRGEGTLFRDIHHLPPATYAEVDLARPGVPAPISYWRARTAQTSDLSFDDAATELGRLFRTSVGLHLRADVPVGAALSGGIDSSAVACAMRAQEGDALDLHTFTFTSPGSRHDEERWADIAGEAAGAKMHKTTSTGADLAGSIDDLIRVQGEPFGSTSIFAQNRVYALVKSAGIKVTLDGQGADEVFAGYTPFLAARLASLLRGGQIRRAARLLSAAGDQAGTLGTIGRAMRFILPQGMQALARHAVGESLVPAWMNRRWLEDRGVSIRAPQQPRHGRILMDELAASLESRVLPALLRYQDRNSMSYSIESRVPFLTTAIVDFAYGLPEDFLISDAGETKCVFRAAMRGLVPDVILDRRDKIGFITPQDSWLQASGGFWSDIFASDAARGNPVFHQAALARGRDALRQGGGDLPQETWRWANLIRWGEIFSVDFSA